MDFEHYAYQAKPGYEEYDFYSEGPKGRIRKVVRFKSTDMLGFRCYGLSFGDWNEEIGKIQYNIKSNNGDTEKVLATIWCIILDFISRIPKASVFIEGFNLVRTRRYRISINRMLNEIRKTFYVYGDTGENWEPFQRDTDYLGFLIQREEFSYLQEPVEIYISFVNKIKHMEKASQENEKRPAVIFLDPPESEEEAMMRERIIKRIEAIGLPEEAKERMRERDRKLFMVYKHPPANEQEAREREATRKELEALNLPEDWIRRFRKFHGIEE